MKVQKKQDKEWIDVKTIADDLSISNPRTISPGGYLDLKEVFSNAQVKIYQVYPVRKRVAQHHATR